MSVIFAFLGGLLGGLFGAFIAQTRSHEGRYEMKRPETTSNLEDFKDEPKKPKRTIWNAEENAMKRDRMRAKDEDRMLGE